MDSRKHQAQCRNKTSVLVVKNNQNPIFFCWKTAAIVPLVEGHDGRLSFALVEGTEHCYVLSFEFVDVVFLSMNFAQNATTMGIVEKLSRKLQIQFVAREKGHVSLWGQIQT